MTRKNPKKSLLNLFGFAFLALFLILSCEEDSDDSNSGGKSELKVDATLNDAKTAYTFYIDSFMRENQMVFNEGNITDRDDELQIADVWGSVMLRWGFRRKPSREGDDSKIYWWQKTSIDVDTQNAYKTIVAEKEKAKFTPYDLPEPLLDEDSIEIYVLAQVGEYKIASTINLPDDFKKVVLGASIVEGRVTNKTALESGRSGTNYVEGAAVFLVHKGSGKIFHGFSNSKGQYRITVVRKEGFYMVVLRNGFQTYRNSITISGNTASYNVSLGELVTGTTIAPSQLYKINGENSFASTTGSGYPVTGSALDIGPSTAGDGIGGTFLLFYNRDKNNEELFFLRSDAQGNFNFKIPLAANVSKDDPTTVSVAGAAYGYIPTRGSETIGAKSLTGDTRTASNILNPITFTPDPSVNTETTLTWGRKTTGGPTGFAYQNSAGGENNVPVFYQATPVTVHMELEVAGLFVPDNAAVEWAVSGVVDTSKTGLSADFILNSRGQHTLSAKITDKRQRTISLARVFDLGSGIGPEDPVVTFDADTISGGTVTSTGNDADGNHVKSINPNQKDGDVTVKLKLNSIDPDTGSDDGLKYEWTVDGASKGDLGSNPSFVLGPGVHRVKVTITSKDGEHSTTITRVYTVAGTPGNGGNTGGGSGGNTNGFRVSFGAGSSGGVLASTLGISTNPLRYSVSGTQRFTLTLKALVSSPPAGTLTYSWKITNPTSTPPGLVVLAPSASRNKQTESFTLPKGSYTVSVSVFGGSIRADASRTYQIVDKANLNLPAGTWASWRAESSGGPASLPDSSPLTTFKDDGTNSNIAIRAAAFFLDAQRNALAPVEWYVDGVLQETITGSDVTLNLPSGGGTKLTTRTIIGIARAANSEPVRLRRVFTLDPSSSSDPLGPRVAWATSSLVASELQRFDGVTARPLSLSVAAASAGSQTYSYAWSLNGNRVPTQTSATANLSLNRSGNNRVSVTVSNAQGSATIERVYRLNAPPIASISNPTNGSTVVLGSAAMVSALVVDADSPTVNYTYEWKIQRPGSSTWENIPGMSPQPLGASFNLPTTGLSAGRYNLRVNVADGYGGTSQAIAAITFETQAQGNAPALSWGQGSATTGLYDFDGSTPVRVTMEVTATPADSSTTYAWYVNGSIVAGETGATATLPLSRAGANTVRVLVSNGPNAIANLERTYTLNTQPTVNITKPTTNSSIIEGRSLAVEATASDAETASLSYTWTYRQQGSSGWLEIPNTAAQPTTASFNMLVRGFVEAQYELRVEVADANKGKASAQTVFSVTKNHVPVVSEITLPASVANGQRLQLNSVNIFDKMETFAAVASDVDNDTLSYTWYVNQVKQGQSSTSSSKSLNLGRSGHRLIVQVEVNDPNGAVATRSTIVKVNYRPLVTTSSADGSTISTQVTDLDGDTGFTYKWTFDGPKATTGDTYAPFALPPGTDTTSSNFNIPNGLTVNNRYRAQVRVDDGYGGERTATHYIDVTAAP